MAGLLLILLVLGIDLGPIIAGAGLAGLGISLASQSLIKDIINGFLILLEDQYGIGDVVVIGDVAGLVEKMNLRITQLRSEEGRLITVPNGHIDIVQNLSKEWSRVDLRIPIDYRIDIDAALTTVRETSEEMQQDATWSFLILQATEALGVDHLDHTGATIRIWIRTQPLQQWSVGREYRRRLKLKFDKLGWNFGAPRQILEFPKEDASLQVLNGHRA